MTTSLSFFGATDTVTGSQYLLRHGSQQVLVDCGLFQGVKKLRQRNWRPPAFNMKSLRDIVLSHAHLDHSGLLPRLYRLGFRGRVHCSLGTRDLLKILLPDAGYLQEEEARYANRAGYSRHKPALPLFTQEDAQACLQLVKAYPFGAWCSIAKDIRVQFHRAGHIIGASSLAFELGGRRVTFTGDVGRGNDPVMHAPERLPKTDYLVCESTYGDREHPQEDPEARLQEIVAQVCKTRGALLIPAFAVGRAQHILHLLARLRRQQKIAEIPIFLDSPMAIRATDLLERHLDELRLDRRDCQALHATSTFTGNVEDSKALARRQGPMIVISASGMATGGRVLHHLKNWLPDARHTVLLAGFQAPGTRGHALESGARSLRLLGADVPVNAKVERLHSLSAHADCAEIMAWLAQSQISPKKVFVTHGEPGAADALRRRIKDRFSWSVEVPEHGSEVRLG